MTVGTDITGDFHRLGDRARGQSASNHQSSLQDTSTIPRRQTESALIIPPCKSPSPYLKGRQTEQFGRENRTAETPKWDIVKETKAYFKQSI